MTDCRSGALTGIESSTVVLDAQRHGVWRVGDLQANDLSVGVVDGVIERLFSDSKELFLDVTAGPPRLSFDHDLDSCASSDRCRIHEFAQRAWKIGGLKSR